MPGSWIRCERYPQSLSELVERPTDIDESRWVPPEIKPKQLKDPWRNLYQYRIPGEHGPYDLFCFGRDGQEGGEGEDADINNWE